MQSSVLQTHFCGLNSITFKRHNDCHFGYAVIAKFSVSTIIWVLLTEKDESIFFETFGVGKGYHSGKKHS